ncbi:MAG: response regulator [Verrucomicrobiales bacterium]|jgi:chemotaxis family two-component system response regulator Rcp1|nr:response regulator [Verrucomicrobiales bacterium]
MSARRAIEILLVEDNPGDVRLAREAFYDAAVPHRFHWVQDGVEALAFLRREGRHEQAPIPDLVLLDLKLPRKGGQELLAELRKNQEFDHLPIFILTSAFAEDPVHQVAVQQATVFLTKPMGIDGYIRMARSIGDRWQTLAPGPVTAGSEVWRGLAPTASRND